MDDEELAAVCVRAAVRHREYALVVITRHGLIYERIARAAGPVPGGVAGLDHEALDDAMELHAVIEPLAREKHEIIHGRWRLLRQERRRHLALGRRDLRRARLVRVDLHRGCARPRLLSAGPARPGRAARLTSHLTRRSSYPPCRVPRRAQRPTLSVHAP